MDALEQALYARRPTYQGGLIHHSDRPSHGLQANRCRATGGQYVSIRYTERLAKAGIEPSVGSVGDAYDNALAETINGLYKTEVIRRRSSWKTMEEVELETLKWPYSPSRQIWPCQIACRAVDASIAYRLIGRLVQQPPPA